MGTQDFLFFALGGGFLILVGFLSFAAYRLAQFLKTLTLIFQDAKNITNNIAMLKNWIKLGLLNLLSLFLNKVSKKIVNKQK